MKVIIGLGNPGTKYEGTRHNTGFAVIDYFNDLQLSGGEFKKNDKFFSQVLLTNFAHDQLLLVKPLTYMNESGKAIQAVKNWHKLDLEDFLVIHDDVSLPLGRIRLQKAGGAGGQHGIESMINSLGGNKGFNRLKIGIGPDPGGDHRADYVLQKFKSGERALLQEIIKTANEAICLWLKSGIDVAMNEFNSIVLN